MKKTIVVVIAFVALCCQGCIVVAIHPFYKEANVVYNKALEGNWVDQDKKAWSIHQNPFKPNSYELHVTSKGREAKLICHLFQLDGSTYLDMMPLEDNSEEILLFDLHLVPAHSIARVTTLNEEEVMIRWFNEETLRKMFTEKRIRIAHEMVMDSNPKSDDDGMYLLTASTDELQKFVAKYGDNEEMYDDDLRLHLTK